MLENELLTVLFAFGAVFAWGAADFNGGLASKKHNVYSVLLIAQLISAFPLAILVLLFEPVAPRISDLLLGGLAGVCGMVGLLNLYSGLAKGRMSIVAPLVAIVSGMIPVLISLLTDGLATNLQMIGFAIALIAIWFLSSDGRRLEATPIELRFSIISGLGFATFYIIIDQISGEAILWTVFATRITSLAVLLIYTINRCKWSPPARSLLPLIALAGLLDTTDTYFFTMATQSGRLDIATIISSLYPIITIILAWIILKERLKWQQWFGVLAAFIAVIMLAF